MIFLLFLLFVCLPLAEIWVLIQAGQTFGVWQTVAGLLVMGFVGAALVRREGRKTFLDLQATLATGQMPANELIHGFLILFGGLLMVTPGFITDVLGILLVFPPTRFIAMRVTKQLLLSRVVFKAMVFRDANFRGPANESIRDVGPSGPTKRGPGHGGTDLLM